MVESRDLAFEIATSLRDIAAARELSFVFKASFDKANRSSIKGKRGIGQKLGLEILAEIREQLSVPIVTDVHTAEQCAPAAEAVDVLQIPAFLCRQDGPLGCR